MNIKIRKYFFRRFNKFYYEFIVLLFLHSLMMITEIKIIAEQRLIVRTAVEYYRHDAFWIYTCSCSVYHKLFHGNICTVYAPVPSIKYTMVR